MCVCVCVCVCVRVRLCVCVYCQQSVICVHGLSRNGRDFDFLAETLAGADHFIVYCLDVVGRGESEYLNADSKETYGYPLYVKDAFAFVQHLGLSTVDFWIGTR